MTSMTTPLPNEPPDPATATPQPEAGGEGKRDGRREGAGTIAANARALRVFAGFGFVLLFVCAAVTGAVVLGDAVSGDGVAGGFTSAAGWALVLSGLTGLAVLFLPRKALLIAQYALALGAPVLALLD
ncbi:hypothetical protein ACGFRB_01190 [Streptomyces sp. NPDC048718]|uniref:hypothetical protein n=1 Tax=Streptomyces sp. NPDC048718 TaxID=3365587 RepID=UPI003715AB37